VITPGGSVAKSSVCLRSRIINLYYILSVIVTTRNRDTSTKHLMKGGKPTWLPSPQSSFHCITESVCKHSRANPSTYTHSKMRKKADSKHPSTSWLLLKARRQRRKAKRLHLAARSHYRVLS